jgi:hypothetical protein
VIHDHRLAGLITAAAAGRHPAADGSWRRVPPWRPGVEAIVAFTGHAVLAVAPDIPDRQLVSLGAGFIPLGSLQLIRRPGIRLPPGDGVA